jgi:succinate dehydrogenase flavin-adding protein (antitoxin of CptAB toxin-antitoxin module)
MFKNFILKQVVKHQAKGMPDTQREQVLKILEKDPQLFERISREIEKRKKGGENETKASIEVMKKYRTELAKVLQS